MRACHVSDVQGAFLPGGGTKSRTRTRLMIVPYLPMVVIDITGAFAMVVLSLLCCYKARILRETDQDNALFLYLVWISTGFMIFGVSRSFGHILRQCLILTSNTDTWQMIAAFSGSVNTVSFMLVSLITLFFNK